MKTQELSQSDVERYRPYHVMPAFDRGFSDYVAGRSTCPYSDDSVEGQAWDRGHEYGMRVVRW